VLSLDTIMGLSSKEQPEAAARVSLLRSNETRHGLHTIGVFPEAR
jgi:hypothetical protein